MGNVRRIGAAGVLVAALAAAFTGGPARAAMGPYKIAGGSTAETHFTERAFVTADPAGGAVKKACDPAFTTSPLNGVDGYVVDISGYARLSITIDYTMAAGPTVPVALGSLQAQAYSAACGALGGPTGTHGLPAASVGSLGYAVPDGAKWLVVNSTLTGNVQFSIR
jgi:hypothetical protein